MQVKNILTGWYIAMKKDKNENQKINFWSTMSQFIGGYKRNVFVSVIFSLFTGAMVATQPLIIRYIVDEGISADLANDIKIKTVLGFCGLYVLISFFRLAFFGIAANSMYKLMEGTLSNLRNAFFEKVQYLSMSFYDKTASGELFNCIMGSPMNNIKTYLSSVVLSVPYQAVSFFF